MCCKKGLTGNGCDGNMGTDTQHTCVEQPCNFPSNYTVAPSDATKAYRKGANEVKFSEAASFCKADRAWLVMPKSTDDIDDIAEHDSENDKFWINNTDNHILAFN